MLRRDLIAATAALAALATPYAHGYGVTLARFELDTSGSYASVCYEDLADHTLAMYQHGPNELTLLFDGDKNGFLDGPEDLVLSIGEEYVRYEHDGYMFLAGERSGVFRGAIYRNGEAVLESEADRQGYHEAKKRFARESRTLESIERKVEDLPTSQIATCDPAGILGAL